MAVNNPHGHKPNTDKKKTENADANGKRTTSSSAGVTRSGTSEQHSEAGRQSHKNDDKSSQSGRQG